MISTKECVFLALCYSWIFLGTFIIEHRYDEAPWNLVYGDSVGKYISLNLWGLVITTPTYIHFLCWDRVMLVALFAAGMNFISSSLSVLLAEKKLRDDDGYLYFWGVLLIIGLALSNTVLFFSLALNLLRKEKKSKETTPGKKKTE